MKRLALLLLLVPAFVAACGGSSAGNGDFAPAPGAPPTEAASDAATDPAPTEPEESMGSDEGMSSGDSMSSDGSMGSEERSAPQGEEIGEQRNLGGDEVDEASTPPEPEADAAPEDTGGEASAREEDTSRPVAPVIAGTDLEGNPLSLEDFKGTPVVVKVYAEH